MRPETMGMSIAVLGMHPDPGDCPRHRGGVLGDLLGPPAEAPPVRGAAIDDRARDDAPEESLRRGTIMVFAGIGLAVAYFVLQTSPRSGPPAWLFGVSAALVGLTGLGYLVYARIARNRDA